MTQWKQSMWITHGETKYIPGEGSGSGSAVVVLTLTLTRARAVVARAAREADLLVEVDPEHDAPGQG